MTQFPAASVYRLTVVASTDVGPRMRRITLGGDELATFTPIPGQDVAVHLPDPRGTGGVSRRYTIRNFDGARRRFDLDVVIHGEGPGARWGLRAAVGETVDVFGPRGKVVPASARWQLFVGDESAIAAIAEIVIALPGSVHAEAILEVTDSDDEQPLPGVGSATWLHRGTIRPEDSRLIDDTLRARDVPAGDRHVYVFGESRVVRRLRDQLHERGLGAPEISAKGYWNAGRAASD